MRAKMILCVGLAVVTAGAALAAPTAPAVLAKAPAMERIPHAYFPPMTVMPKSRLIAAFALRQGGQTVFIDTRGKVVGRMDPKTHSVIWTGNSPHPASPKHPAVTGRR